MILPFVLISLLGIAARAGADPGGTLNLYNWNDYFAEETLAGFQAKTGIRPRLDVYDANEVLEAKLFAGRSGYDLVFPTARPFAARHIQADL
ncbi:MAG: spermidine/putrescine ABC transporter substrate-binding protein PotF, partial [Sphingobacteriia bacterium]|nr:spermidine/putrescine ABC transporter substrate-binding protein PotF [Sphingobacteriia bacterium]